MGFTTFTLSSRIDKPYRTVSSTKSRHNLQLFSKSEKTLSAETKDDGMCHDTTGLFKVSYDEMIFFMLEAISIRFSSCVISTLLSPQLNRGTAST